MSLFGFGRGERNTAPIPTAPAPSFLERTREQLGQLGRLTAQASSVISPEAYSLVRQVDDVLRPLMTYIERQPLIVDHEVLIQNILTEYIPTPIQTYMRLDAADRGDNSQADLLLRQQFATIRDNMLELAESIRSAGLKELSVQAGFISERFRSGV
jgi:hypothetical protein